MLSKMIPMMLSIFSAANAEELGTCTNWHSISKTDCIAKCLISKQAHPDFLCEWNGKPIELGTERAPCALMTSAQTPVQWALPGDPYDPSTVLSRDACEARCRKDLLKTDKNQICFWGGETLFDESAEKRERRLCQAYGWRFSVGSAPLYPMTRDECEFRVGNRASSGVECAEGRVQWGKDVLFELKEGNCTLPFPVVDPTMIAIWEPARKLLFLSAEGRAEAWTATWDRAVLGPLKARSFEREDEVRTMKVSSAPGNAPKTKFLVVTRSPKPFSDPGDWKPRKPMGEVPREQLEKAYLDQARPKSLVWRKDDVHARFIGVFPTKKKWMETRKVYSSRQGLRLFLVRVDGSAFPPRESAGIGDVPEADYGNRWILETAPNEFRVIPGRDLSLIDIGDYDGDGRYELVFAGQSMTDSRGGYFERDEAFVVDSRGYAAASIPLSKFRPWKGFTSPKQ